MDKVRIFKLALELSRNELKSDRYAEVNQYLVPLGLARWHLGSVMLSEKGKQFIFQQRCKETLGAVMDGQPPQWDEVIRSWLLKHEFVLRKEKSANDWQVTWRGRDWLSQLD